MNIMVSINNSRVFLDYTTKCEKHKNPSRDFLRKVGNAVTTEEYTGIGTIFRYASGIRKLFVHQHNISKNNYSYLITPSSAFSVLRKVFDYAIGTVLFSAAEALFHVARAVYDLAMGALIKIGAKSMDVTCKGPIKDAKYYLVRAAADLTKGVSHVVKMIPLLGSFASEYIFDPMRHIVYHLVIDKEAIDENDKRFQEAGDLFEGGFLGDYEMDAIPYEVQESSLDEHKSPPDAPASFETPFNFFSPVGQTPDQACFRTSEVKRMVQALRSHLDKPSSELTIGLTEPMGALQAIHQSLITALEIDPLTLDLTQWQGAYTSMPDPIKGQLATISYLLSMDESPLRHVEDFEGIDLEALIRGALEYGCDDVMEWLTDEVRIDATYEIISNKLHISDFTAIQEKHAKDPEMLSAIDCMFKLCVKATTLHRS